MKVHPIFSTFEEPWLIALICALLMVICWQAAFHMRRWSKRPTDAESGSVLIDEACLAILGLLLAFTFAAAYSKYDNRNAKVAEDASALRTLHHRCDLLPEAWRQQFKPLVRNSVDERLAILRPDFDAEVFKKLDEQAGLNEQKMFEIIRQMNQDKDAAALAGPVADACYAVAASHESRLAAAKDHVPAPVIALLILVASISAFLLGRSQAIVGRSRRTTVTLIVMVSAILYVTLDLELPLKGLIQTDQSPILRLADTLGMKP